MKRKCNIVDAILIVLMVVILAGAFWFLRMRGTIGARNTEPIQFTVELNGVTDEMIHLLQKGEKLWNSTDSTYLGTLKEFSYEPFHRIIYLTDVGKYVQYDSEEVYHLYLLIENDGYETAKGIFSGDTELKIGNQIFVKGKGFAGGGYVVGVDTLGALEVEDTTIEHGDTEVVYRMEVADVRDFTADSFQVGDKIYAKDSGALLGNIEKIEKFPYITEEVDKRGNLLRAEKPDRYRIILTIHGVCQDTEKNYFLDEKQELKIGADLSIVTKRNACWSRFYELISVDGKMMGKSNNA